MVSGHDDTEVAERNSGKKIRVKKMRLALARNSCKKKWTRDTPEQGDKKQDIHVRNPARMDAAKGIRNQKHHDR